MGPSQSLYSLRFNYISSNIFVDIEYLFQIYLDVREGMTIFWCTDMLFSEQCSAAAYVAALLLFVANLYITTNTNTIDLILDKILSQQTDF